MSEERSEGTCGDPVSPKPNVTSRYVWVSLVMLGVLLVTLGVVSAGRKNELEKRLEMKAEMKRFVEALYVFEEEFGSYPSDRTAEEVRRRTGTELSLTGADVLNQLEVNGIPRDGLGLRTPGLAKGNWKYVPGMHSDGHPDWPILISPEVGGRRQAIRVGGQVSDFESVEFEGLPDHIFDPVIVPKG